MACCRKGASKLGTFVRCGVAEAVSIAPKEMMSTMLETSFLTCSGRVEGKLLPFIRRLHKYIASANSGNMSCPDLVVSESTLYLLAHAYNAASCYQPDVREITAVQLGPHQDVSSLVSGEG